MKPLLDFLSGKTITLLASAARTVTAGTNGDVARLPSNWKRCMVLLDITASAHETADYLDVYVDVSLEDGATKLTPDQPRAKASKHFYEPGPIWRALESLASSAKEKSAIVFRRVDGQGITAGEILDSMKNDADQGIANEYVDAMTEAMVLRMRGEAEKGR